MRQMLPHINILYQKTIDPKSPGIFTTIKIHAGLALFLDHHLNRLRTSGMKLNILKKLPPQLKEAISAAIKKNKLQNGGIKITITPATICIHAFTIKQFNNKTIKVITTPDTRNARKTHKITDRSIHLLAQKKALSQGAQDALFTQNNQLIESTISNIFSCTPCNTIITPPIEKKGLNGIARQILIENLPVQEQNIPADTTGPIILVNSLGVRIVKSIDGKKINQNPEFINLIRQTLGKAEKKYITNSSSRTK